ncbi:MAG: rhodanese-like domain-containing protein [Candidatus Pacebacteria bacterium]|nr:rhodanese-like domain-containing protein [Candidatus Paceibacterota bacterium]
MFKSIPSPEAKKLIAENEGKENFIILDIRTPQEFAGGSLPDARNLDFYAGDFVQKLSELGKENTYLIFCRSGNRSKAALGMMQQLGFNEVYELDKGIISYL